MKNEDNETMSQWAFPDVNEGNLVKEEAVEATNHELEKISDDNTSINDTINGEFVNRSNPIDPAEQMELLKNEYEKKITLLNQLLNRFRNPASVIDDEIVEIIESIIKKLALKIIRKEIETDPKLIHEMIDELRSLIDNHGKVIKVYLSETDYNRLDIDTNLLPVAIEINHTLVEGDIVIKSEFNEIRALLNDRIDQIIRIKHE